MATNKTSKSAKTAKPSAKPSLKTFAVSVFTPGNSFEVKVKALSQRDAEGLVFRNIFGSLNKTQNFVGWNIAGEKWKDLGEIMKQNKQRKVK
jgi:hypothetical protein